MEFEPIMRLSDAVIGQIAAGEVVERPAAVVKELVENSIDAGATAITVELKDGGIGYLRVSDNGRGIPAGQVRMAFERHATSKLRTAEELFSVRTLGFRGEALASIAAVAKVTCVTRTADADFGIKTQVDAGMMGDLLEAASPVGTTITMRQLFYNAPVRLRFLKKPTAEAAFVSDYMMRLILSKPDIAFRFVNEGKTVYRSAGDGTLESAIYCVYGRDALRAMYRVQGTQGSVILDGYIGVGDQTRGNRLQQSFFINGRYFRSELLGRALENACEGYVMIGRYPSCVLTLIMPYHQVDVNVHPNKMEVRFQNPEVVALAVMELSRDSLRAVTMQEKLLDTPKPKFPLQEGEITLQPWQGDSVDETDGALQENANRYGAQEGKEDLKAFLQQSEPIGSAGAERQASVLRENSTIQQSSEETLIQQQQSQWITESAPEEQAWHNYADTGIVPQNVDASHTENADLIGDRAWNAAESTVMYFSRIRDAAISADDSSEKTAPHYVQDAFETVDERVPLRYIGAVFKTYLLFEAGERLLMVDQHAAHERVLFDRFMARYEGMNISQRLMAPQLIRLTARDVSTLADMGETLAETGFDIEPFDATSVAVRAVPVILGETEPLRDVLLDVLDAQQTLRGKATRERLRRHVAQMACKHAIKAGDALRQEDVRMLLEQMLSTGAQPTCPHGRPIVSEMPKRELEKRFKRIQ